MRIASVVMGFIILAAVCLGWSLPVGLPTTWRDAVLGILGTASVPSFYFIVAIRWNRL